MSSKKVSFRNKNGRNLTNSTTTTEINRRMHLKAYMETEEYQNNLRRMEEQKKRESKKHKKHSKKNSKKNNAKKSANNATTKANNTKK